VLAAETGLGHKALDLGGLVESLCTSLDFTSNNVLADIILLLVKVESLDDVVSSLGSKTVGALDISDTSNFLFASLDDAEEDSSEVSTDNATTD
jgi:hypothetical protein